MGGCGTSLSGRRKLHNFGRGNSTAAFTVTSDALSERRDVSRVKQQRNRCSIYTAHIASVSISSYGCGPLSDPARLYHGRKSSVRREPIVGSISTGGSIGFETRSSLFLKWHRTRLRVCVALHAASEQPGLCNHCMVVPFLQTLRMAAVAAAQSQWSKPMRSSAYSALAPLRRGSGSREAIEIDEGRS